MELNLDNFSRKVRTYSSLVHQKDRNAIRRFGPFCVVIDYDEAALAKGEKAGKFGEDQT